MSWDSTIFAKVFLTRRMVRRDAGLWAQHSDISFNMALKHWGDKLFSDHNIHFSSLHIYDLKLLCKATNIKATKSVKMLQIKSVNILPSAGQNLLNGSPHHYSIYWIWWAAVLWRTQPPTYPHKMGLMAPSHNMVVDSPQRYLGNNQWMYSWTTVWIL